MEKFKEYNEGIEQRKELDIAVEMPEDYPGCYVANNMVTNLCETCYDCFADCGSQVTHFGYGIGNDNVVVCDCYNGPAKDNGQPDNIDIRYCSL